MPFFYFHAGAMTMGVLLMAAGAGVARFQRQQRWWLKAHRIAGMMGSSMVLLGLVAAILMVNHSGSGHFKVPHAGSGLIMILLALLTPVIGQMQFKFREKAKLFRVIHRWSGRITLIIGLLTILSGLQVAGII
jgi:hypothetical protein